MAATPATRKTVNSGRAGPAKSPGIATITAEPARPNSTSATSRVERVLAPGFSMSASQHATSVARQHFSNSAFAGSGPGRLADKLTSPIPHPARGFQSGADAFELSFEIVQEFGGA